MAEIAKNMLEVLALSLKTQERIAQILKHISERSESNTLALAQLIDDHTARPWRKFWKGFPHHRPHRADDRRDFSAAGLDPRGD